MPSRFLRTLLPRRRVRPARTPPLPRSPIRRSAWWAMCMAVPPCWTGCWPGSRRNRGADRARLILAGDLVDRGPDSAAVLARVRALCEAGRAVALMGNHERMMLDFLDAPAQIGPLWLANGGDATLFSLGVNPHRAHGRSDMEALAAALRAALPPGTEDWLRALPLSGARKALAVSHAGADPARPFEDQDDRVLLWGHRDFRRRRRGDGLWIVHGHVIAREVRAEEGRIGTDTGAFATGRLSAVWLDRDGMQVLEARAESGPEMFRARNMSEPDQCFARETFRRFARRRSAVLQPVDQPLAEFGADGGARQGQDRLRPAAAHGQEDAGAQFLGRRGLRPAAGRTGARGARERRGRGGSPRRGRGGALARGGSGAAMAAARRACSSAASAAGGSASRAASRAAAPGIVSRCCASASPSRSGRAAGKRKAPVQRAVDPQEGPDLGPPRPAGGGEQPLQRLRSRSRTRPDRWPARRCGRVRNRTGQGGPRFPRPSPHRHRPPCRAGAAGPAPGQSGRRRSRPCNRCQRRHAAGSPRSGHSARRPDRSPRSARAGHGRAGCRSAGPAPLRRCRSGRAAGSRCPPPPAAGAAPAAPRRGPRPVRPPPPAGPPPAAASPATWAMGARGQARARGLRGRAGTARGQAGVLGGGQAAAFGHGQLLVPARDGSGQGAGARVDESRRQRARRGQGRNVSRAKHFAPLCRSCRGSGGSGGLRGQFVAPPDAQQQRLEGGIGGVEGLAPADVGLAVEIAVIGLVDAVHLFARLPDQRGEILPLAASCVRPR